MVGETSRPFWHSINYLFFCVGVLVEPKNYASALSISKIPPRHSKPEIWLSGYVVEDSFQVVPADGKFRSQNIFENDFVSKAGNDFVVSAETGLVIFTCEANYPIAWKFPFPRHVKSFLGRGTTSKEYRISEFADGFPEPINTGFRIVLTFMFGSELFLSANLTCISIENRPDIQSSIYIYLADRYSLEHQGETVNVTAEPASSYVSTKMMNIQPILLPCRPSSPSVKLALEKQSILYKVMFNGTQQQTKKWSRIYVDNNLRFDPKVGFTLERGILGDRIFGLYRCSVMYIDDIGAENLASDDGFILVNVTKSSNESLGASYFEPRSNLSGRAKVYTEILNTDGDRDLPRHSLVCCTGKRNKRPMLYVKACLDAVRCETLKKEAFHEGQVDTSTWVEYSRHNLYDTNSTDCATANFFGVSTLVICKGENVDYADEFVQLFHPEVSGPVANRSERVQASYVENEAVKNSSTLTNRITLLSKFETASVADSNQNLTERAVVILGHEMTGMDFHRRRHVATVRMRFDKVPDPLLDAVEDAGPDYSTSMETEKPPSVVYLMEYDRDVYYDGEPLTFMCFGVKAFYTDGPHMRLNWKNGTKTILHPRKFSEWKEMRRLYLSGNGLMFDAYGIDMVDIFSESVVARQDMSSVDCWMPSRNTSGWDKITKSITVVHSVAAKFEEKEDEVLYLYLGDVNKTITCTETGGVPFPEIHVLRDGTMQGLSWKTISENDTETIQETGWKNGTKETETTDEKKHIIRLRIEYNNVTHDDQSVWECIAKNANGTVKRTIRVIVLERHGVAVPISLGIAGVLLLLAIGLGVKHWRDKRNVKSLRAAQK